MQLDPPAELPQRLLDPAALVDHVVVEDEVDCPGSVIDRGQKMKQTDEEPARFPVAFDVDQPTLGMVICASQVALLVPTRSLDVTLLPPQRPVRSDPRVLVDVDLVDEEHDLAAGTVGGQGAQLGDPILAPTAAPGASDERSRPLEHHTERAHHLAQVPKREPNVQFFRNHLSQDLERPSGSLKAMISRSADHDLEDSAANVFVDLERPVLRPPIEQALLPFGAEAKGDSPSGRWGATQGHRGGVCAQPFRHLQNQAAADPKIGIAGLLTGSDNAASDRTGKTSEIEHRETSLSSVGTNNRLAGEVLRLLGLIFIPAPGHPQGNRYFESCKAI
ncbi:MAG: hypothetical protein IPK72_23620 [Candidatus Eisenbacteria bacterium]|nr:hypothetical protein [Candidatus Eisenbacteria bacterium]